MNPNVQTSNPNIFRRLALTGALLVGAGALAACSNDEGASPVTFNGEAATTVVANPETLQGVEAACGTALNLEANSANVNYAGPEALLPSLQTVADNTKTLFSPADASNTLKQQVATDARVLATLHANITETRRELQAPDSQTIGHIGNLINTYTTNSEAAALDATELCDALAEVFIVPTESFGVNGGQATEFITVRDENGNITEIKTRTVANTTNLRGYKVSYNKDGDYDDVQRAVFDKLENLVLVTADGTVVVNNTLGEGAITVEDFEDKTTATPEESPNDAPANGDNGEAPVNASDPTAGNGNGGGNGGGGDAPTSPSTPDAPGEPDTTGTPTDVPGSTGGPNTTGAPGTTEGPGTTGPNTTNAPTTTRPTTPPTTVKPTTTTAAPTTTVKPTTTTAAPTTTVGPTTTVKGAEPPADCVNNPNDPRC